MRIAISTERLSFPPLFKALREEEVSICAHMDQDR